MRIVTIIVLISTVIIINSCKDSNQYYNDFDGNKNLVTFCKLWGFLKYNHPEIGGGVINWDSVLIASIDTVVSINNKDSLKQFFENFLPNNLNGSNVEYSNFCDDDGDSVVFSNKNLNWMSDTNSFHLSTIAKLNNIYSNNFHFENKYISANQWVKNPIFDSDTLFNSLVFPNKNIRLLSLFRYWNIINYYYPYKYITDYNWEDVLEQYIPIFINANDTLNYHLAVCKLTAMINDNHGYTSSSVIANYFGSRFLPVKFDFIEDKTVITEIYSDSLAISNNLQLGDIIINIDGIKEDIIRDSLFAYFSGANPKSIQHIISYFLSRSSNDKIELLLQRNDSIFLIVSKTYPRDIISKERSKKRYNEPARIINDTITYIDLSKLNNNADSIITNYLNSKVLILDLRKNCKFILHDIAKVLFGQPVIFYAFTTPQYEKPGLFCYQVGDMSGPDNTNLNSYKGKIIVLINERTQSIGEFTTMLLMRFNNVKVIGSTTAGADGNISAIYLPGKIKTYISGIGIYWPDGKQTQRVGIPPDIEVHPKIESIKMQKDDVLQKAVEYATSISN